MIAIVNFGMGNLGSIRNMLKRIGIATEVTSDPAVLNAAKKLILPGVGAFDQAVRRLKDLGLVDVLNEQVLGRGKPILGICLGMQLFGRGSEEGSLEGLGWLDATCRRFTFEGEERRYRIPHMGWNLVSLRKNSPLFARPLPDLRYYFVHSYHMHCEKEDDVLAISPHGIDFVSCVQRGNIYGVQFHPEKSHKFGLQLLSNFASDC